MSVDTGTRPTSGQTQDSSTRQKKAARQPTDHRRRDTHKLTRWLHTYLSMVSLALILFFGLTGITLNHPDWTLGLSGSQESIQGTLPEDIQLDENIDFLAVAQYLQAEQGVRGDVTDYGDDGTQGTMSFNGPGYAADLFFDARDGSYELAVDQQGLLAVMNDLHKGRDTGGAWNWTIDVAAGFLVTVALTGLGLQFFIIRRRTKAFVVAVAGTLVMVGLIVLTVK